MIFLTTTNNSTPLNEEVSLLETTSVLFDLTNEFHELSENLLVLDYKFDTHLKEHALSEGIITNKKAVAKDKKGFFSKVIDYLKKMCANIKNRITNLLSYLTGGDYFKRIKRAVESGAYIDSNYGKEVITLNLRMEQVSRAVHDFSMDTDIRDMEDLRKANEAFLKYILKVERFIAETDGRLSERKVRVRNASKDDLEKIGMVKGNAAKRILDEIEVSIEKTKKRITKLSKDISDSEKFIQQMEKELIQNGMLSKEAEASGKQDIALLRLHLVSYSKYLSLENKVLSMLVHVPVKG